MGFVLVLAHRAVDVKIALAHRMGLLAPGLNYARIEADGVEWRKAVSVTHTSLKIC